MKGSLDGRVALVTGGGSGIGRGVVEAFVAEGAKVGVLEISKQKVESLRKLRGSVRPILGDATSLRDNESAVDETVSAFGRLDVLVCCPGIFDFFIPLLEFPKQKLAEAFDELFSVNVKSYVLSTKAALKELLNTDGNIIYTLSNSSFYPDGGGTLYVTSKFALRGLVLQMAFELAPKVRVNGVAPGGTLTEIRGLRALGQENKKLFDESGKDEEIRGTNPLHIVSTPADHAWAYVYLASKERARAVSGTIIHTDGGLGVRGLRKLTGLS